MTKTQAEKLKKLRDKKTEDYARAILSSPVKASSLLKVIPFPGVALIMGDIRNGKTGLAHEIACEMHRRYGFKAAIHLPNVRTNDKKRVQALVPDWMAVTTKRKEWPQRAVIIYDEAAQSAHARRSQTEDALDLDDCLAIAGQREQLILFISHYSRKLDLNVCTSVHTIIWKQPTYAHTMWERGEMADFTMKAFDFFKGINGEVARKKATLILDMKSFIFYQLNNKLPPWWSEDLSRIFKDIDINSNNKIPGY
ncbi:MAG: hypothetical protein JW762_06455 [Dehalococcoidales bacterium]|nr:hypothetical protein [Dehalococcoidales bacterium]